MLALLRKNASIMGYAKAVILFSACLLFSISSRVNVDLSFHQHILSAVSDHYYLTYFLLPMVLYASFSILEDDEAVVILRYQTYAQYFLKKWLGLAVIALMMVSIQTVAISLSGLGLPLANQWQIIGTSFESELFSFLQGLFVTPFQAFVAYSIFQWLGMTCIFGFVMWLGHYFDKRETVFLLVGLYFCSALWIKISALQKLPLTGFNHLLILHHNLIGGLGRLLITGLTVILTGFLMILSLKQGWTRPALRFKSRLPGIYGYYWHWLMTRRNLSILIILVTSMTLYKWLGGGGLLQSGSEWIKVLFAGHGTGSLHLLSFLELLIASGTPLYILALFIENALGDQSVFLTVRTQGRREILKGVATIGALLIGLYSILWIGAGMLSLAFSNWNFSFEAISMLVFATSTRFLDIFLQFLILFAIYLFTKQVTLGFLAVFAMHLVCLLPLPLFTYLPMGLSSLSRTSLIVGQSGIEPRAALMELLFLNLIGLAFLVQKAYKKMF